jgi:hypothetical protein
MTPDDLRQEVELKIVEYLKVKLADGSITEEKSQTIAKLVLDTLVPGMSFDELYKAIFKLDDTYTELAIITLPFLRDYEKNVMQKAQDAVQNLISQGQYNAANKLADKAITGQLNVVWQAQAKP